MATRLALGLAVLLVALAIVQWRLRDATESQETHSVDRPLELAPAVEAGSDLGAEVEEPVLEIPEYVPPRITERPRTPVEFSAPELEIDFGVPRVGGAVEAGSGTLSEP